MTPRKPRKRSPHPGVIIVARTLPSGLRRFQLRYRDPDTGRVCRPLLDASLTTVEARTLFAKRLSETLAERRVALASGAPVRTHTGLSDALKTFYEGAGNRLRPKTLATYKQRVARFQEWAEKRGVSEVEQITPAHLSAYREALLADSRARVVKGGKRGQRMQGGDKRAAVTANSYLTSAKIVLNHFRALGHAPSLTRDNIADALKPLPVPREAPAYLSASEIAKALQAALRHDADCFAMTRAEHRGEGEKGATTRYTAIAPFMAAALLSGMRRGELLALLWSDIDWDARDAQGNAVGEIRLDAARTKTHRARSIGLEISPALRKLLASMKLRAGDEPRVFPFTADEVEAARKRLVSEYGAPSQFTWQLCRSTASTYLVCSSIFGNGTAFLAARALGHSVEVAERFYAGTLRGLPREARTLEAVMQLEPALADLESKQVALSAVRRLA